jgi:hypothetical protein
MEPRLVGCDEPQYSNAAKEAFISVIMKVAVARRLPDRNEGFADGVTELDRAIEVAEIFCNPELLDRMRALREAAIQESMGGPAKATRAAQDHFTLGCRLALGTND